MDRIQPYRQPMITATGVFLGFMLELTSTWITEAFSKNWRRDLIIAISIFSSLTLMLIVLFRMLRMDFPEDRVQVFYRKTLYLFLIGIFIPFLAFVIIMIEKFIERAF